MTVPPVKSCLSAIDVLVLAGGLGTRIRPVLGDTPKLLAPIAGSTYLDHLLGWLARFGARRVVLALGHRAEVIVDHLARRTSETMVVETVIEPQPLGTAGAIRWARRALRSDPVLIVNGDSFADVDLCQFLKHHRRAGAAASILCAKVPDAGRYGRIETDAGGTIRRFVEKDRDFHGEALVNAGMYFLSTAFLDEIAAGQASALEKDVFERLPPGSLAVFAECGNFIDIGTPESFVLADALFRSFGAPR